MSTTTDVEHIVTLPEYGTVEIELGASIAASIQADGRLTVAPLGPGRFELRGRSWVGVLRYETLEVRIEPKVPIGRLLYLAAHGGLDEAWSDVDTLLTNVDDPRSALAEILVWHAERALRPTPLQGYRIEESSQKHLRGRLLFERQLARRAGVTIPVELRYDEFDLDILENQVLAAALRLVEPVAAEIDLSRGMRHLRHALDGVTPWPVARPIPEIPWTRLNKRYQPAIQLARLLLDRNSVEFEAGSIAGRSFLVNMPRVFESFLTSAMRRELERLGGRVDAQRPSTLDERDEIVMYPDITWWLDGRCRAVIDAKYKRVKNDDSPNADAYQMLAYCTRLGVTEGWLVYADLDGGEAQSHVIRNADVTIRVEAINLAGDLHDLATSVKSLAGRVTCDRL